MSNTVTIRSKATPNIRQKKYGTFVFAFFQSISVTLIGRLFLSEVFALLALPFIKFSKLLRLSTAFRYVLVLLLVLLFGQIVSDVYNTTTVDNYLRGWALIVFAGISTTFLFSQFLGEEKNITYYLFGTFLTLMIFGEGDLNFEIQYSDTNYFKSRFVGFINPCVLLLSYHLMRNKMFKLIAAIFLLYALICFYFDARSNGLIFIFSGLLVLFKFSKLKLSRERLLLISALILGLVYTLYIFYVDLVLYHEFGGKNAYNQLSSVENPYNPLGLLFRGRTEIFLLIEAIKDKPLIGHGSWAQDPGLRYARLMQEISGSDTLVDLGFIKAHSILFGFWAYSGVIGMFCIFLIYWNLLKRALVIYKSKFVPNVLPIVIFCSIEGIWHLLFSPIQHLRISAPFFIAIVLSIHLKINLKQRQIVKKQTSTI